MINQVIIEGEIQKGWQDKPAVSIRKTKSEKEVVNFSIISKYGPDEKFSSGIVKVERWPNANEIGMFEMLQAGDIVTVQGAIKTGSYEKDGAKVFYSFINADEVSPMIPAEDPKPIEQKDDQVQESGFDFQETPKFDDQPESGDDTIPF